jgi:hypothetical protein
MNELSDIPFQDFNGDFDVLGKLPNQRYFDDDSY